ncbi:NADH dehydrogenase [Thermoanaerobacterium thermosaccharolyticum]|uniref:NADH:ubiquinone oxidoreductase 24 kD subunit n=2 Tax=Thermoanaerobacterium thermosaccharolyticum TaxID=1517 RepID=A0A223I1T9_THETR|nr:(2Fe-2S) ferredoxin domain-containing protein [Thermoanaerobacterium thermosaccharolyticum]AGB19412.1 NADH:ubiquinone oxidoreductase 24 kD subunit [Thermoanaerobacterium thermosaccharolyticum M0795]AST58706.1 NADH:ubiquinone oxidoreductase 24 kD subunit [Thermoanaerobacterium thermosaccharolyticum]PHO06359.1 NADH dehydrogenase [Thermoanaerobacterium thermosaccharolyticum]
MVITICVGSSCHLKGSYDVINELKKFIKDYNLEDRVELKADFCMGNCLRAVSVKIDDGKCLSIKPNNVEKFFREYVLGNLQ